jgi:hypothetical protein
MTFAFPGSRIVRLAAGLHCLCGRELQASDVDAAAPDILLTCQGCHRDILEIERETSR